MERTSLSKTTAFRLLATLQTGGMLERAGPAHFRRKFRPVEHAAIRIGFAAQASSSSSPVWSAIAFTARPKRTEWNWWKWTTGTARKLPRSAEILITKRVELVLEFQTYENVAPIIASRFLQAGIPVIAIEIPHPGAIFFGADNYQAGLIGGRALAKWAKTNWNGQVEEVLLLQERIAGPLPGSRVTGMLAGIREWLPAIQDSNITTFDGKGAFRASYDAVKKHLRRRPPHRTLVAPAMTRARLEP